VTADTSGVTCETCGTAGSCVAAGVGSCAAGVGSSAAVDDSGSVWGVCASTGGAAGSGAEALGAAPGRRRAALGANFLPVVFSVTVQRGPRAPPGDALLMKALVKVAAGFAAGALSPPAVGGAAPSSADMLLACVRAVAQVSARGRLHATVWRGAWLARLTCLPLRLHGPRR
jgi:hypothetical protein